MKKRNKKFFKEKAIIRLKMKGEEINKAIYDQGWIELEEPIHNGYYAEWILRADISRRDDAASYQEALDACKDRIWSKTPDFRHKDRKTKKWVVHNPKMKSINKDKYEALSPAAKKHYIEDLTTAARKYWRYGYTDKIYRCTLSYELVVVISKAYTTHRREHNNVLYQMDAENEKLLYQVADGHPWDGHGNSKWWRKHEDRKTKLAAERDINEVKKVYKGEASKNDLLDI